MGLIATSIMKLDGINMDALQLRDMLNRIPEEELKKPIVIPIYDYENSKFIYNEIISYNVSRDKISLFMRHD